MKSKLENQIRKYLGAEQNYHLLLEFKQVIPPDIATLIADLSSSTNFGSRLAAIIVQ